MKTKRILSFLLLSIMMLTPALAAEQDMTFNDVYCFSQSEPGQRADAAGVIITNVPGNELGVLKLGSRTVLSGDVLTQEELRNVVFLPSALTEGDAEVTCLSILEDGTLSESQMTFHIGSGKNSAPTAEDSEFETYRDIPGDVSLNAADPDGDSLTVTITKEPRRGTAEPGENGTVLYTPNEGKVGKDSFSFTVTDAAGNVSPEATVRIRIKKPSDRTVYADMTGDSALLPATWLRETGIFTGETVSGTALFYPEAQVTRGEFIAMCVGMTGLSEDAEAVSTEDLMEAPQWLSPYVSTFVRCGYISGVVSEDGTALTADSTLTTQEAQEIVSSILGLPGKASESNDEKPEDEEDASASDSEAVETAVFDTPLTRRDAAVMLYDAWNYAESEEGSLLSWAEKQ